jgi:hypothetical protein
MGWIIKPGFFTRKQLGKKQPGLDLERAIADIFIGWGLLCQKGCCAYQLNPLYEAYQLYTITNETAITLKDCTADHIIDSAGTISALTINFPPDVDGRVVSIGFDVAVTTLTINETIRGTAATSAAIGTRLRYKFYDGIGWMRTN